MSQLATRITAEVSKNNMRIYLLGLPRAECAGRILSIPRRQVRALFYRLAAQLQPVSREHLCFLLWADEPDSIARRNLSRLLPQLRSLLPVPQALVVSNDSISLKPESTWSDTVLFERLCATLETRRQAEVLAQAVDLYHGPFLEGFSLPGASEFESWASLERERWQRLYLKALVALVEEQAACGDLAAAIRYARRYLETDDLAEDIHRRLIELYAASGDRGAALRQFERCVAMLERELGVSPLPETQAVYQAVLNRALPHKAILAKRPTWAILPTLDVPLIGRDGALHQLQQAYSLARAGHGQVVFISGEAGIGKSRLMQDFCERVKNQTLILAGSGHLDAQSMPYQPIVEALRPELERDVVKVHSMFTWLAEMSRLLPELNILYPDLPPPAQIRSDEAHGRLFEALRRFILALASETRVVLLCLDNLHWADGVTLDWLAYLGRRIAGSRLMVIGTYRSGEADALTTLRQSLERQGLLLDLALVGLDEEAVLQIVRQQAHADSSYQRDKCLATRLRQVTGGNPFFLLETLRVLIESGQRPEEQNDLEAPLLPDTVRAAVEARLARLSSVARQVLEAGSVLGVAFDFDTVHLTAGRHEMETMDSLDELVARQLLLEHATGYRFRHEIVREVAYRGLSRWRRRLLHRRAGDALEKLHSGDASALSRHLEYGEEPGRAARYALQAGQSAQAVFAHAEARSHFERALVLLEREASLLQDTEALTANQRLRLRLLHGRGWALRLLGDMEAYAHDLEEVEQLARALGDQAALAHLRWRESYAHRWFCRYAQARVAAEEGLRLSQATADSLLEGMCWREIGRVARATGDYELARTALERALHISADLGEVVHELHALSNLSTLHLYLGEYERAMLVARRALARCDKAGLSLERRLPLGDVGAAAAMIGDLALAQRCLAESLAIARQISDRTQEIFCLGHLGWLCTRKNQAAEALDHLQAALALAEQVGSCAEQSWLHSGLAEAHRLRGEAEQARTHARRALELAEATSQAYDRALACRALELNGVDL